MINTPPSQRPPPQPNAVPSHRGLCESSPRSSPLPRWSSRSTADASERDVYGADISNPATPRPLEEPLPAAANAAVALAQLHHHRQSSEWESDAVRRHDIAHLASRINTDRAQERYSEPDPRKEHMRSSIELPPIRDQFKQEVLPPFQSNRPRELLPSILSHSPPGRSSTLPPIQRRDKVQRPRKSSVGQNARKAKHERNKSREFARRLSIEGRKAMSAEPPTAAWAQGKRWEDLIEAATSATEAGDDRDLTPVSSFYSFVRTGFEFLLVSSI